MKIKVIQYNICTGFRDMTAPFKLNQDRINKAKKIIKKENPDILFLNEAYFESKNNSEILMDYQKIFGFDYYVHGNTKDGLSPYWGDAILSKYPIINFENKSEAGLAFKLAKIKVKSRTIDLAQVHLLPIPAGISSTRQRRLISRVIKILGKNSILCGDFNTLSPLDRYNKKKLTKSWSKFTKNVQKVIEEMLKRDAMKSVLSSGLIDTYKARNDKFDFTIPTDFLSKDKSSGVRIDYIFCSKEFKVLSSGVIRNNLTEKASDHYPVYAVLEI